MMINTFFYIFVLIQPKKRLFMVLKIFINNKPFQNKSGCKKFILGQNLAVF